MQGTATIAAPGVNNVSRRVNQILRRPAQAQQFCSCLHRSFSNQKHKKGLFKFSGTFIIFQLYNL
jgi:hypothetical protein